MNFETIAVFFICLLIAMSIHEAMHGFVAHWLGDDTAHQEGRLTLNPVKHVDLYMTILLPTVMVALGLPPILAAKPVPFDPYKVRFGEYGAALVGLAGPFTNILLAIIGAVIVRLGGFAVGSTMYAVFEIFISLNVGLFVFNMMPIPPLDGSRLVYAFAPEPLQRVMRQIESYGLLAVLAIFLLLFSFISPILININTTIINLLLG